MITTDGPWLVISGTPTIRFDVRWLDGVHADDDRLILTKRNATCTLETASNLVTALAPHAARHRAPRDPVMLVAESAVYARGPLLWIGSLGFLITDIEEAAERGASVPVTNGSVPATLLQLAVMHAREIDCLVEISLALAALARRDGHEATTFHWLLREDVALRDGRLVLAIGSPDRTEDARRLLAGEPARITIVAVEAPIAFCAIAAPSAGEGMTLAEPLRGFEYVDAVTWQHIRSTQTPEQTAELDVLGFG